MAQFHIVLLHVCILTFLEQAQNYSQECVLYLYPHVSVKSVGLWERVTGPMHLACFIVEQEYEPRSVSASSISLPILYHAGSWLIFI